MTNKDSKVTDEHGRTPSRTFWKIILVLVWSGGSTLGVYAYSATTGSDPLSAYGTPGWIVFAIWWVIVAVVSGVVWWSTWTPDARGSRHWRKRTSPTG